MVLDLFIVGGSYQAVFQYQGGWASSFLSGFWGVPWYTLRKSHTFLAAKSLINGGSHGKLINGGVCQDPTVFRAALVPGFRRADVIPFDPLIPG